MRKKMQKQQRNVLVGVIVVVVLAVAGLVIWKLLDKPAEEETQVETPETVETEVYGYAVPETIATTVAKFNTEVMDQTGWELTPADDEAMVTHEENYWYPLDEDLALVAVPKKFNDDKDSDTTLTTLIYSDLDDAKRETALKYFRLLIQANTDWDETEVQKMIEQAESLSERGEMANNGQGIFVAINKSDDHIEYQVVRNYEDQAETGTD